ncbi:MAG: type secretion system rane subunit TssM, partial [Pseudomonadota bacterium]
MKKIFSALLHPVTLTGLGLLALSLLIWFAGPLLAFAGHVPLESSRARWVTIAL